MKHFVGFPGHWWKARITVVKKSWRNSVFSSNQWSGVIYVEYYKENSKNTVKNKTYINTLDDGFGRPKTMNYLRCCTWNIEILPLTEITKLMPASYLFASISACWERNKILSEMILVSLWTQTDFGGIFKIIQVYERYDGANKMQIEQHCVIP